MHSPAERTFEQAQQKLDDKEYNRQLMERRGKILGNIVAAARIVKGARTHEVVVPDYGKNDEESLAPNIRYNSRHGSISRGPTLENLIINGELERSNGLKQKLPMYRIGLLTPNTDSGIGKPMYEISVHDPEVKAQYQPLALIEQTILDRDEGPIVKPYTYLDRDYFGVHGQLSPSEMAELQTTGIYVNPHGEAMLDEVQSILGLMISQQQAHPETQAA